MNVDDEFDLGTDTYRVTAEIASGGFGKVYTAETTTRRLPRTVAVKVPHQRVVDNEKLLRRFKREARILANTEHANIVKVIHFAVFNDGTPVLVQEFIRDAQELSDCFAALSGVIQYSIALQILYGLRATHGQLTDASAIHRDLSPRNVLVGAGFTAKVIDFGLAKENPRTTNILTQAGEYFGTPGCIAPEQKSDAAEVDHRVDIFAYGKTIAACLQQRSPDHADVSELPEPWGEFCSRCTKYNPDDRFETVEQAVRFLLKKIADRGESIDTIHRHMEEILEWNRSPASFRKIIKAKLLNQDGKNRDLLKTAYMCPTRWYERERFDADGLFEAMDSGAVEQVFGSGGALFDACDSLGDWLRGIFPYLTADNRKQCFRRMCRTAVDYHRYSIMYDIRGVASSIGDPTELAELRKIRKEEDPTGIIKIPTFDD